MATVLSPTDLFRSSAADPVRSVRQPHWRRAYASRLVVTDVLVLTWALFGSALVAFGPAAAPLYVPRVPGFLQPDYWVLSGVLVVVWTLALSSTGSRGYRLIGTGTAELKAVLQSAAVILVLIAMLALAFQIEFSRGYVLTALAAGLVALVASRWLWRMWLRLHRQRGAFCSRVLLVGSAATASQIAADLRRHSDAGYHVLGAVLSEPHEQRLPGGIPVLGGVDDLLSAVQRSGADTVFVTDGHNLSPDRLRDLSWSLIPGRQHLVMAPSLTDIAGPRIHARPVAGLPLVHVETPRYEGADRFLKRSFDVCGSLGLLLVLSLPLLIVAAAVLTTSPGGLFFGHERIGKNGRPFRMLKFRSMVADADAQLATLLQAQGTSDRPLFKIANDPRITRVGAFLRRYSIDEIPQLINVLRGDMSLVGPRPQVAREVALYSNSAARRLFVKPGMTGLWQVSGRSNLDWDEALRLDLYYVENWSMTADLAILLRTIKAVVASEGAV